MDIGILLTSVLLLSPYKRSGSALTEAVDSLGVGGLPLVVPLPVPHSQSPISADFRFANNSYRKL